MALSLGRCGQMELVVTAADTAQTLGTGDVPVLSTPRIVELCEQAAVRALAGECAEGQTSVGFRVEVTHVAPVAIGSKVVAAATLERTEGKRLVFNVNVIDRCGLVAAGRVTRVLVDTAQFLDKAR
ncbi:MAG TPA: hotdog domain-containing protein [Acidimicrobiales bacterium]|nr:hotdog domain-containing protein [Acidimicrobiales bacterium]